MLLGSRVSIARIAVAAVKMRATHATGVTLLRPSSATPARNAEPMVEAVRIVLAADRVALRVACCSAFRRMASASAMGPRSAMDPDATCGVRRVVGIPRKGPTPSSLGPCTAH